METELSLDALLDQGWDLADKYELGLREGLVRSEDEDE